MNFSFVVGYWYQIPNVVTHAKILTEDNYELIKDCYRRSELKVPFEHATDYTAIMLNVHVCEKTISKSDIIG